MSGSLQGATDKNSTNLKTCRTVGAVLVLLSVVSYFLVDILYQVSPSMMLVKDFFLLIMFFGPPVGIFLMLMTWVDSPTRKDGQQVPASFSLRLARLFGTIAAAAVVFVALVVLVFALNPIGP